MSDRQADMATYVQVLQDMLRDALIREARAEAVLREIEAERDALKASGEKRTPAGTLDE